MPWSGAGGQNIEHPHTLAIFSYFFLFFLFYFFFFLLQMHFSFIGKAQFRRATLSCDSAYYKRSRSYVTYYCLNLSKQR